MKKSIPVIFIFLIIALSTTSRLSAAGQQYEQNAKVATLGGAFAGRADDASAIYYNPAGIAFLPDLRMKFNLVGNWFHTKAGFDGLGKSYQNSAKLLGGSIYLSTPITDKFSLGIGFFLPYMMETMWPSWWEGKTQCLSSKLNTYYFRPTLAFKLNDHFSLGAGLDIALVHMEWKHIILFTPQKYDIEAANNTVSHFKLNGHGLGYTLGMLFKLNDHIQVGCKYQHKLEMDLNGDNLYMIPRGQISYVPYLPAPGGLISLEDLLDEFYKDQKATSATTFPAEFVLGFMLSPWEKLNLLIDIQWKGGSQIKMWDFATENPDESLSPEFTEKYGDFYGISPNYSQQGGNLHWKDSWNFKFGCEYYLSQVFALRAGYTQNQASLDKDSSNSIYPDFDHKIFSIGFGYDGPFRSITDQTEMGGITINVFLQYYLADKSSALLSGYTVLFDARYWLVGFGVGLNL